MVFPHTTCILEAFKDGRMSDRRGCRRQHQHGGPRSLNRRGGVSVAGELMGRFLGPAGGDVLIILGMHRIIGHEEREMGFRSLLRERFPACTIAASLESGEDQGRAGEVVYQALRSNPGVQGIYNVSAGNSAIAKVIRALGLTQKIVLITHELTPERRAMLREGVLDAIIGQNPVSKRNALSRSSADTSIEGRSRSSPRNLRPSTSSSARIARRHMA
jgi:ABC-type sugar transport system substrate-binding protein